MEEQYWKTIPKKEDKEEKKPQKEVTATPQEFDELHKAKEYTTGEFMKMFKTKIYK